MTIRPIAIERREEALEVWYLQHASYRIEAELIQFPQLPPLMDTLDSLQNCQELFYGFYEDEELAGAVAAEFDRDQQTMIISRMMVHPDYFRRGIASRLMRHAEHLLHSEGMTRCEVSTAKKNEPAMKLYRKHGFRLTGETEIAPGVWLAHLEKKYT